MSATKKRADMIVDDIWAVFGDFIVAVNVYNEPAEKKFKLRIASAIAYHLDAIANDVEIAIKDIKS